MKFLQAVLILSGMIIGVGMFGIPFSFAAAGFWLGALELAVLMPIMVLLHVLYGEIVIKTPALHRLPGYIRIHLGSRVGLVATLAAFFGITGILLAYIVIGSTFLHSIALNFWPGSNEFFWAIVTVASGALVTLFPMKKEALINGILTSFLIIFILVLAWLLFPQVEFEKVAGFRPENLFLPYGVLLFALAGGIAIPDLVTLLNRERTKTRLAIVVGTVIPACLYFLFAYVVVGVSGTGVSEDALSGLRGIVDSKVLMLGSIIGFLAVYTSFIILNSNAQAMLALDFRSPRFIAWLLPSTIPFLLYLLGFQSFIAIIAAVGTIAVGIEIGLIIAAYHRIRRNEGYRFSPFSYAWKTSLFLMVAAGVMYELLRGR